MAGKKIMYQHISAGGTSKDISYSEARHLVRVPSVLTSWRGQAMNVHRRQPVDHKIMAKDGGWVRVFNAFSGLDTGLSGMFEMR